MNELKGYENSTDRLTKMIKIFFIIIIAFIIVLGRKRFMQKNSENSKEEMFKEKVSYYLKKVYPKETFEINYLKRTKLKSEKCKIIWLGSCVEYEIIPGKYTYHYEAYDSKHLKFSIEYDEEPVKSYSNNYMQEYNWEYDDSDISELSTETEYKPIRTDYIKRNTEKIIEDYYKEKIEQIMKNYNVEHKISSMEYGEIVFRLGQEYEYQLMIYSKDVKKYDDIVSEIYNETIKNKIIQNPYIERNTITTKVYFLNNRNTYNILYNNFDKLIDCVYGIKNATKGYICKETNTTNDNTITYYLITDSLANILDSEKYEYMS